MKRALICFLVFILTTIPILAYKETKVEVVSCVVDLKVGRYDKETKIILEIKDEENNIFTNVYSKQQIMRSDKGYNYILENSNCVYLMDKDYEQIKSQHTTTYWFWIIFLLCIYGCLYYLFKK